MSEKDSIEQTVTIGPWQRISQQTIYDNPWIRLTHEEVITPAGTEGIYGKIHFKNRAIGIIPLDEENNTLLVGQHRYAQGTVAFPAIKLKDE